MSARPVNLLPRSLIEAWNRIDAAWESESRGIHTLADLARVAGREPLRHDRRIDLADGRARARQGPADSV